MTEEAVTDDAVATARRLRTLVGLLLVVALAAGVGAFWLSRPTGTHATAGAALLPPTYREPGFVVGAVRKVSEYDAPATDRRLAGRVVVPAGSTAYLVARCDAGTVEVTIGATSSSRSCVGAAAGVLALRVAGAVAVTATVSARQSRRWGVAIYA